MTSDRFLGGSSPSFDSAPHPIPAPARPGAQDTFALLALVATFAAVIGMFVVSPVALEARGIAYIDAGGGFFAKFHPATSIAALAFVMRCLAARRPIHVAWHLTTGDAGILLLLASVVVAGVFAQMVDKTPVTPLVDTFVLPVLVFVLLRDLDRRSATWLAALVASVLVVNAGLAIIELLRGFHFIQVEAPPDATDDPTKANGNFSWKADLAQDWRAEALLGHPLVNGLVVGSLMICLAAPGAAWIPLTVRSGLLMLQAASMFAFGARTALVLSALFATWLVAGQVARAVGRGARLTPRILAPGVLAAGVVVILLLLLVQSGFVDKTLDRFTNDSGSAGTRLTMFQLFEPMSLTDLFLQPDKDLVATLQRVYGLEFGIESSWIGLVLSYGIIIAAVLTAGFLAFWRSVLVSVGSGGGLVFVFYLISISVTASVSGKTTTCAMVVALLVLFLRKDAATAPAARHVHEG